MNDHAKRLEESRTGGRRGVLQAFAAITGVAAVGAVFVPHVARAQARSHCRRCPTLTMRWRL